MLVEVMKKILSLLLASLLLAGISGCSLLSPGKKEFFQTKMPAFPEKTKVEEKQKQAATYLAEQVGLAYDAALLSQTTNTVMVPLREARTVAEPLAESLGPPTTPYKGPATNLVADLRQLEARYDAALRKLEAKLGDLEGKKIEGTGLIQMGYFTWLLLLFGVIALLFFILKIVAIFNPPVQVATSAISAGAHVLRRGFSEVIEAGEKFKDMVKAKVEDPETQEYILDLFRRAHMETQSRDVQQVIQHLTAKEPDPAKIAKQLKT